MPEDVGSTDPRPRFIPLRREEVIAACRERIAAAEGDVERFDRAARLLVALYHHAFHDRLETLKDLYAPFNPDLDTVPPPAGDASARSARRARLAEELEQVLEAANFRRIDDAELRAALNEASLFDIRLHVDFDAFEHIVFFRRGETQREETVPALFGLRRRTIRFVSYDRVVVFVAFREEDDAPGATLLKMFRNVPRADLEMLFPNSEVRMRGRDKLAIGVPAAASGVALVATKLGPTLLLVGAAVAFALGLRNEPVVVDRAAMLTLGAGLGTVGAYLYKQVKNFRVRRLKFLKTLADNLYFRNLDNNAGVFHRLIDAAEEEESKEALLAWTFLLTDADATDAASLDAAIEAWLRERVGRAVDFEIEDALGKLRTFGLVERDGVGVLHPCAPAAAVARLDARWDALFEAD